MQTNEFTEVEIVSKTNPFLLKCDFFAIFRFVRTMLSLTKHYGKNRNQTLDVPKHFFSHLN